MPIEIRELIIKSTIVERPADSAGDTAPLAQGAREAMLRDCRELVQKLVYKLLRERTER